MISTFRAALRARFADAVLVGYERLQIWAAIVPGSRHADRFGHFGRGSLICFPPQVIYNEHAIRIGDDTIIGPRCSLTVGMAPGQELIASTMLEIGDRCVIGRNCAVAAHLQIVIGDDVYFAPNVFVTDQNHGGGEAGMPIGRSAQPERPVSIGARSWLATGVVVTPGVTIGEDVIVGANSVVTADLPDGSIAVGAPARIVGTTGADPHPPT